MIEDPDFIDRQWADCAREAVRGLEHALQELEKRGYSIDLQHETYGVTVRVKRPFEIHISKRISI